MKPTALSRPLSIKGIALTTAVVAGLGLGEARAKTADLDGDGIANLLDPDVDGDGIPNGRDLNVDGGVCRRGPFKGKYVGDHLFNGSPNEKDIDADGFKDSSLAELDIDGDGKKDTSAKENDIDGDGRSDDADSDIDGDGLANTDFKEDDIDGDGIRNHLDDDCDGDGRDRAHDDDDDADGISDDSKGDDGSTTTNIGGSGAITMITELPQTILGPGASPDSAGVINVSLGELAMMGSTSAAAFVESFATKDPLALLAWLDALVEADRGIDPGLVDSRWGITTPEDEGLLIDRLRRLRDDIVREHPAEETPAAVDETVPAL